MRARLARRWICLLAGLVAASLPMAAGAVAGSRFSEPDPHASCLALPLPPALRRAVVAHAARERAALLCLPRDLHARPGLATLIYTLEGACGSQRQSPAGACSNQWDRHLIGIDRGRLVGPTLIGGKGRFQDERTTVQGRTVHIQGAELGPRDALCCPTQAARRTYRVDGRRFVQPPDASPGAGAAGPRPGRAAGRRVPRPPQVAGP